MNTIFKVVMIVAFISSAIVMLQSNEVNETIQQAVLTMTFLIILVTNKDDENNDKE